MIITLIRHAKTGSNCKNRYMGRIDECLCAEGIVELESYTSREIYPDAKKIFSSPLKRCKETAKLIYPHVTPTIIDHLKEISFGEFEGKTYDEIMSDPKYKSFDMAWEDVTFPNGENLNDFKSRVIDVFFEIASNCNSDFTIVCHGGVIMALMQNFFGKNLYDWHIKNCHAYQLDFDLNNKTAILIGRIG